SVAEFLLTAIGYSVVPKLRGAKGAVTVALRGVLVPEWRYALEVGQSAPVVASKVPAEGAVHQEGTGTARISAPAAAFIMATAGRDRFDDLRATGALSVE